MAGTEISVKKLKNFWNYQVYDEANWASNMKLLRAAGLFVSSIIFMRNFGDSMAV